MAAQRGDANEDQTLATSGDWRALTTAQKNHLRQQIVSWLGDNYSSTPGVWLLVELVYQHYTHFCGRNSENSAISQKVFGKILMENYPNVSLKQHGKRGKSFRYFVDLDIQESSDEYDSVIKGRRVYNTPTAPAKQTKRKSSEERPSKRNKADPTKTSPPSKDPPDRTTGTNTPDKTLSEGDGVAADCEAIGTAWRTLPGEEKEKHREQVLEWLETEYEVAPHICVLREDVYNHYLHYCRQHKTVPTPQAMLGRLVQKKFVRVLTRRLGARGASRYYYMGIDIRSDSDQYATVSQGRVVCLGSKPKNSRFQNGS